MLALRARQQRNFLATLMVSQGVPMLAHGDELGRTQGGNNNVYCQDNPTSWMDWALAVKHADLVEFTGGLARLRAAHPVFRRRRFFAGRPIRTRRRSEGATLADIAWFTPAGEEMTEQDWDSGFGKCVTVFLNGDGLYDIDARGERVVDDSFLLCFNAHFEDIEVTLPPPEYGTRWAKVVDTAAGEIVVLSHAPGIVAATPPTVDAGGVATVAARSLLVLQRLA